MCREPSNRRKKDKMSEQQLERPGEDSRATEGLQPGQKLTHAQAQELFFKRESWCMVEMKKESDWCRATRKHNPDQFRSTVFSGSDPSEAEPRCNWAVNAPTHRHRRHFVNKCKFFLFYLKY